MRMSSGFSGMYYKHQKGGHSFCVIHGKANEGEFVQVIMDDRVYQFNTAKNCRFGSNGITLDLPGIKAKLTYHKHTPLKSDIMGPFRFLPMQCRHTVVSMFHKITGSVCIDGTHMDFDGGIGYIEGDSGLSFPKEYLWLHCNDFTEKCSILVSIADIPLMGIHFRGCICAIVYKGREYRLATYHNVKIHRADSNAIVLTQGNYRLKIAIRSDKGVPLKAPKEGMMTYIIHESNNAAVKIEFSEGAKRIFCLTSQNAGFECNL